MAQLDLELMVSIFVTFAMATASIVLRIVCRRMINVKLWYDDWLALLSYLSAVAWCVTLVLWTTEAGLGFALADIPGFASPEAILEAGVKYLYVAEICYAFALAFAKLSILAFYWRMFSLSSIRLPIQILVGASVVWLIIRTFMAVFHCVPIAAFWDKSIEDASCNINDSQFFFGTVLVHLILDLVILALPVVQIQRLQLKLGKKVAVIALFMFGVFVCIASVVVLVESLKFDPSNPELPLNIVNIMIWATVEVNFAIVSACLPMLRPIFRRIVPGSALGSSDPSKPTNIHTNKAGTTIKLTTISRRGKGDDDDSSTRELAGLESRSNDSREFEPPGSIGMYVVGAGATTPRKNPGSDGPGIHVRNETSVQVEYV